MKKFTFLRTLLVALLFINSTSWVNNLYAEEPVDLGAIDFSKVDVDALRNEVREVENYLNSLPPAERKRIEDDALRLLEQMPEDKFNSFIELTEKVAQPTGPIEKPTSAPTPSIETPSEPVSDAVPKVQTEQLARTLRTTLQTLVDTINSVEAKIKSLSRVSQETKEEHQWHTMKPSLDTISSLVHQLLHPIASSANFLLEKLASDGEQMLRENLQQLTDIFVRHAPLIQVPDVMGMKRPGAGEEQLIDPVTKRRSIQAVKTLLQELNQLNLTTIVNSLEQFMKRYVSKDKAGKPVPQQNFVPVEHTTIPSWQPPAQQPSVVKPVSEAKGEPTVSGDVQAVAGVKQELTTLKDTINQNSSLKQAVSQETTKAPAPGQATVFKDAELSTFTLLDGIRETARRAIKHVKKLGQLSEQDLRTIQRQWDESQTALLHAHIIKARTEPTLSPTYQATLSRVDETLRELDSLLKNLQKLPPSQVAQKKQTLEDSSVTLAATDEI